MREARQEAPGIFAARLPAKYWYSTICTCRVQSHHKCTTNGQQTRQRLGSPRRVSRILKQITVFSESELCELGSPQRRRMGPKRCHSQPVGSLVSPSESNNSEVSLRFRVPATAGRLSLVSNGTTRARKKFRRQGVCTNALSRLP